MGISIGSLLIVLVIALLVFGTKKLRNLGGDLGGAIKSFKNAVHEGGDEAKAGSERLGQPQAGALGAKDAGENKDRG